MCRAAAGDSSICAVTVAMCAGTGLLDFSRRYPTRLFDVGIAEEHAVRFRRRAVAFRHETRVRYVLDFRTAEFRSAFHDVAIQRLPLTRP